MDGGKILLQLEGIMWEIKPSFCTFVIPTKGRASLKKAIQSVLDQTDWNWRCTIVFDGIPPVEITGLNPDIDYLKDNHFIVRSCDYKGHAGLVRNEALPLVDTYWTAFLDDDDFLKPTYLNRLKHYSDSNPDKDIIVFTYRDMENGNTQPPKNLNRLVRCNVGMSFAVKTDFIRDNNILFDYGVVEDFAFLNECANKGAKYLITHDVQYFVGHRSAWS